MAFNLKRFLKQRILYWEKLKRDGHGRVLFAPLVELDARWEFKIDEFIDITGERALSSSIVLLNQDIVLGSYMYFGTYDEWLAVLGIDIMPNDSSGLDIIVAGTGGVQSVNESDPFIGRLAKEVRGVEKIPDIKAKIFVRKAYLI